MYYCQSDENSVQRPASQLTGTDHEKSMKERIVMWGKLRPLLYVDPAFNGVPNVAHVTNPLKVFITYVKIV